MDPRDDGVLLNVCIQGPTPMRNSKSVQDSMRDNVTRLNSTTGEWLTQAVDDTPVVGDYVYLGLFRSPKHSVTVGAAVYQGYQYKMFTDGSSTPT